MWKDYYKVQLEKKSQDTKLNRETRPHDVEVHV